MYIIQKEEVNPCLIDILPDSSENEDLPRNVKTNPSAFVKEHANDEDLSSQNSSDNDLNCSRRSVVIESEEDSEDSAIGLSNELESKNEKCEEVASSVSLSEEVMTSSDNSVISILSSNQNSIAECDEDSQSTTSIDDHTTPDSIVNSHLNDSSPSLSESDSFESMDELGAIIRNSLFTNSSGRGSFSPSKGTTDLVTIDSEEEKESVDLCHIDPIASIIMKHLRI